MSNVAVSVVMPVFNSAPYVENAIKSVLNQSFSDFELIIVDDGSTDNSRDICTQLANSDPRIFIASHNQNLGLGAARNTGLDYAQGTFVYFVDSDDLITPDTLKTLHKAAIDYRADFVHCSSFRQRFETSQGVFSDVTRCAFDQTLGVRNLPVDKNARLKSFFCRDGAKSMTWLNFFRRDFFVKNNLRFPNILFEDVAFFAAALALADTISSVYTSLYVYSKRKGSLTNSKHDRDSFRQKIERSIDTGLRFLDEIFNTIPATTLSDIIKDECKKSFVSKLHLYGSTL